MEDRVEDRVSPELNQGRLATLELDQIMEETFSIVEERKRKEWNRREWREVYRRNRAGSSALGHTGLLAGVLNA